MDAVKIFIVVFFMPFFASATELSDSVVKINSYYSTSSLQPRLGSGLVILWHGKKYVLTSDHVIYHSNKNFTHEITDSLGHHRTMNYLLADAGRGLALLSFPDEDTDFAAVNLDPKDETSPVLLENITMIGYPADSDAVLVDKKGQINSLNFASELFIELPELTEVKGGHGEFGMSGGAAFSADGFYRGLLSHQIVDGTTDNVLLIPAAVIRWWLAGVLKHPSLIDLFQDPAQQVSDFVSFRSTGFYMTFTNAYGKNSPLAVEMIATKDQNTDLPYGGVKGPFSKIPFKNKIGLSSMGFRKAEVLGEPLFVPQNPNMWLRAAVDPKAEILWTYYDGRPEDNVRKARAFKDEFEKISHDLLGEKTPKLVHYTTRIANLLESQHTGDPMVDDPDEQVAGAWRFIKPKDLDFILNDASLKDEWKEARVKAPGLRQKLTELRAIMAELTY